MAHKEQYTIELTPRQHAYLTELATKHGLPDEGKVVRCLINFAHERPDLLESIFDEIRCQDCG